MAEALLLLKLMKKRKIGIDEVGDHTGNFGAQRLRLILALGPASEFTRWLYRSKNIYVFSMFFRALQCIHRKEWFFKPMAQNPILLLKINIFVLKSHLP